VEARVISQRVFSSAISLFSTWNILRRTWHLWIFDAVIIFLCLSQGLTILWLTAMIPELRTSSCQSFMLDCSSATAIQLAVLFISMGLISIGAGCIRPCSIAFGADQLTIREKSNNGRLLDSFFNWYYTSVALSTVISLSVIVYIQENLGWKIGFGVPAALMFISALSFLLGSPIYVKAKPGHSLLTSFLQVVVVAIKNRKLCLPHTFDQYYQECDSALVVPTDSLRYLCFPSSSNYMLTLLNVICNLH